MYVRYFHLQLFFSLFRLNIFRHRDIHNVYITSRQLSKAIILYGPL